METNPRDYGERCRFDAFCKTVLKHEAIDYIREMKRRASRGASDLNGDRQAVFSGQLPQRQLCVFVLRL